MCKQIWEILYDAPFVFLEAFEVLVHPQRDATVRWDAARLGQHAEAFGWHGARAEAACSPGLACCEISTCRDTQSALAAEAVRVRLGLLRPFVPLGMPEQEASWRVRDDMQRGAHLPPKPRPIGKDNDDKRELEEGELEPAPVVPSGGTKRKAAGQINQQSVRRRNELTVPGRLVFIAGHLETWDATTTDGHVHEVVSTSIRDRPGVGRDQRVLKLAPLPPGSGPERELWSTDVIPMAAGNAYGRAWAATINAGDEARKLSLYHGLDRHTREFASVEREGCTGFEPSGVLRQLIGGNGKSPMSKPDAKRYAAEMEAMLRPPPMTSETREGSGATSSTDHSRPLVED